MLQSSEYEETIGNVLEHIGSGKNFLMMASFTQNWDQ